MESSHHAAILACPDKGIQMQKRFIKTLIPEYWNREDEYEETMSITLIDHSVPVLTSKRRLKLKLELNGRGFIRFYREFGDGSKRSATQGYSIQ